MKKLIGLVIVVVIAFVMAMTVPDKKAHKSAMMKAVKEYVDEEAANRGFADNGLTRVGKNLVVKTIEEVLSNKLRVTNYFLFNTTHIEMKEKDKLLSVGMFGHVFTFDKEMLRDALEGSALEKEEAKLEEKRLKEEIKAEKKRLKEEAKAERKRQKEAAKAEKKRLKEEAKAEKERLKAEKKKAKEEAKENN
ncbi:MAG: DUF4359 domain-containing protein [Bacteroidaceae bacterium]|nr:DUF4359 domain-containing protein [Bacteroidaceae bacterium]